MLFGTKKAGVGAQDFKREVRQFARRGKELMSSKRMFAGPSLPSLPAGHREGLDQTGLARFLPSSCLTVVS